MTLPPCFAAPTSPRRTAHVIHNNGLFLQLHNDQSYDNALRICDTLRKQHQEREREDHQQATVAAQQQPLQTQLFSPPKASSMPPPSSYAPRPATPDHPDPRGEAESLDCEDQDDDDAARMLLGLSKLVTKEMSCNSECMARKNSEKNHESRVAGGDSTIGTHSTESMNASSASSFLVPKSITIDHSYGDCSDSANGNGNANANGSSHLIRVTSNESMEHTHSRTNTSNKAPKPMAVLSSKSPSTPPSFPRSTNRCFQTGVTNSSTIDALRASQAHSSMEQRTRTVSLAGEDMVPVASGGSASKEALSPLLLPLSPSRDLSLLGIHENVSSRSHLPRFQHPLFRQELQLLEQKQQQLQQEHQRRRTEALRLAAAASAAAIITPIPRQPRPVLFLGGGDASMGSNMGSNTNRDHQQMHSPLEFPPLLLNVKMNQATKKKPANNHLPERPPTSSGVVVRNRKPGVIPGRERKPERSATRSKKVTIAAKKKATKRQYKTGKKFSWKAYPELEEFLISNREEYLSFSARNYTIEQRDYNNRLTAQLLDHAAASGYPDLFKNCAFSAVRDRIRSYYKSYVQSFKRRKERQQQLRKKALQREAVVRSS